MMFLGGSRSNKRGKIVHHHHRESSRQFIEAHSDKLRCKEVELHKKNAEILELMIKSNLPSDTVKEFISKASFN